jgi:hypothetical protein
LVMLCQNKRLCGQYNTLAAEMKFFIPDCHIRHRNRID